MNFLAMATLKMYRFCFWLPSSTSRFFSLQFTLASERMGMSRAALDIPIRSLANVNWSEQKRLVELGNQKQKRYIFNVAMAKKFMTTYPSTHACQAPTDTRT